jgi:hypothetical protein
VLKKPPQALLYVFFAIGMQVFPQAGSALYCCRSGTLARRMTAKSGRPTPD